MGPTPSHIYHTRTHTTRSTPLRHAMDPVISLVVLGGVLLASAAFLLFFSSSSASSTSSTASLSPSDPSELTFQCITSPTPAKLPSLLSSTDTIELSVIVPAYNEELRLPSMLEDALSYLTQSGQTHSATYEILVVDDGSTDNTTSTALAFAESQRRGGRNRGGECIRVVTLSKNRGKGGAVKWGMLHARGKRLLFVDADGASEFSDLGALMKEMDATVGKAKGGAAASNGESKSNGVTTTASSSTVDPRAIVLGSRAHMVNTEAVVKRSKLRNLLMISFHTYLSLLGISNIRDTQCGFKLFTRSAATAIFPNLHVTGWIFDIEILIIASLLGDVEVREVPIRWREVEGSKMNLVKDSIKMATDLLVIRTSYALGTWKVRGVEYMQGQQAHTRSVSVPVNGS